MSSRNPLNKRIVRRCPEIVDSRGRDLEITLDPEDGGSVLLRWSGDKGGPFKAVSLREIALGEADQKAAADPAPKKKEVDLSKWCSYEALISFLHIVPVGSIKARICMINAVNAVRDFRCYQEWFGNGMTESWQRWKEKYSDEALIASSMPPEMPEEEQ